MPNTTDANLLATNVSVTLLRETCDMCKWSVERHEGSVWGWTCHRPGGPGEYGASDVATCTAWERVHMSNEVFTKWREAIEYAEQRRGVRDFIENRQANALVECANEAQRLAEVRPEVRRFALAMEERLRANEHKGGWRDLAVSYLMARLHEESAELDEVVRLGGSPEQAKHDAADVANFAMMVADGIATLRELVSDQVVTKLPESQ